MKKINEGGHSSEFDRILFIGVVISVLALSVYLFHKLNNLSSSLFDVSAPSIKEVWANIQLLATGYGGGFGRTLKGYFLYGFMAAFFLLAGQLILKRINLYDQFNRMESLSYCYILGSLATSLLWFLLGFLGLFTPVIAWIMVGFGGYGIIRFFRGCSKDCLSQMKELGGLEKILGGLTIVILLALSVISVIPPHHNDTLNTHLAISNFYMNEGGLAVNPFHFYTYSVHNTEILMVWALLLKSEVAASLLMWGFYAAFLGLIWGVIKRYGNRFAAFTGSFAFLSIPIIGHSAMMIKPDLPAALFIFSHLCLLAEYFANRESNDSMAKKWLLLSAILLGGAIGHKLVALPVAFCSALVLLGHDCYTRKINGSKNMKLPLFLLILLLISSPWFLRAMIHTGNPLYPFFGKILTSKLNPGIYGDVEKKLNQNVNRQGNVVNYIEGLLLGKGRFAKPSWGPTLLFGCLAFLLLRKKYPTGIRLTTGIALLSLFLLYWNAQEARYHLGVLSFIVMLPLGLFSRFLGRTSLAVVVTCFVFMYGIENMWKYLKSSMMIGLSGHSHGNYLPASPAAYPMRWLSHLINNKTEKEDKFFYAGVDFIYGINRRGSFSSIENKQEIGELAKKSANALEIKKRMKEMGIQHILLHSRFYDRYRNHSYPDMRINQENLDKIGNFFKNHTVYRTATPDRKILWYSLDESKVQPINFTAEDAREFPLAYINEARVQLVEGNSSQAQDMIETALTTPMSQVNKLKAYTLLASLYQFKGDSSKAGETMMGMMSIFPELPESYYSIALYYQEQGQLDQAMEYYQKAIDIRPDYSDAYSNLGNLYFGKDDLEKAKISYEKAIQLNQKHFDAINNLGSVYYVQKNHDLALKTYWQAIEINPNIAEPYTNIGNIHYQRGKTQKAMGFYQKAVKLDPKLAEVHINIGNIYSDQGDFKLALEAYRNSIAINPDPSMAYQNMGNLYQKMGDPQKAKHYRNLARRRM